jgi:hypothetical protein
MRTYKEVTIEHAGDFIEFTDGDKIGWIPKDSANSDYQEYLNPEAEHFTPNLPA